MDKEMISLEKQMEAFRTQVAMEFPSSFSAVEWFPSGAFLLDLTIGKMKYFGEYLPSHSLFGITSDIPENDCGPFWCAPEHAFKTFGELEKFIFDLLVAAYK